MVTCNLVVAIGLLSFAIAFLVRIPLSDRHNSFIVALLAFHTMLHSLHCC